MKKNALIILLLSMFSTIIVHGQNQQATRLLSFDFSKVKGVHSRMFAECIGAGRANEGLRADWQEQLKFIKQQLDFKYIRMHGLLTDDMGVYFEDKSGNPVYNWQYIDKLFDFLISIKMKPFVEFGFYA